MSLDSVEALKLAVYIANKEFVKGFVVGQVFLCVLIFFLAKTFLFKNGQETRLEFNNSVKFAAKVRWLIQKSEERAAVLQKLRYQDSQSESLDWINVVIGHFLANLRRDQDFLDSTTARIDAGLENSRPSFFAKLALTEFAIGNEYPTFRNARIVERESMIVLVDFTFDDQITLGIDTLMIVNWPQEAMASLPISISFSVKRFSGTLAIELGQYSLAYSIINDFVLDFEVKSLMGHRTKIKDLPKLTNLITRKLRQLFVEHLVFPAQHSMNLF